MWTGSGLNRCFLVKYLICGELVFIPKNIYFCGTYLLPLLLHTNRTIRAPYEVSIPIIPLLLSVSCLPPAWDREESVWEIR